MKFLNTFISGALYNFVDTYIHVLSNVISKETIHDPIYVHCGNHLVFNLVYFKLYQLFLFLSSRLWLFTFLTEVYMLKYTEYTQIS